MPKKLQKLCTVCLLIEAFLFWIPPAFAQWVKEDDTTGIFFREGVYLTQESFFANRPAMQLRTLTSSNWKTADSLTRLGIFVVSPTTLRFANGNLDIRARFLALTDSGGGQYVSSLDTAWGICIHGIPFKYILHAADEPFVRIPVTGPISFLSYVVLERDIPEFNTVSFPSPGYRRVERKWIVDFEQARMLPFSNEYLYEVLKRDTELLNRFEHERKKRRQLVPYIQQYNHRHPYQTPE